MPNFGKHLHVSTGYTITYTMVQKFMDPTRLERSLMKEGIVEEKSFD
jgi:hypothetical protein